MVKGSDWKGKHIIGEEYCGKVILYERTNGYSTTKLLEDYINKNGKL
jgi:bifunctional ADP-heptose synthase (sugar kinase/adenylyltransferase)